MKVLKSLCLLVSSLAVISCGGHGPTAQAQTFTADSQSITSPLPTPSDVILTAQPCFFDSNTVAETCLLSFLNSSVGGNVAFAEVSAFFTLPETRPSITVTMNYLGGAFGSSDVFPAQVLVFSERPVDSNFFQIGAFAAPTTNNLLIPGPWPTGTKVAFIITGFVANDNGIECLSLCSWDITVPLDLQ